MDQTSISFPCPEFIAEARGYLEQAGYSVDAYPPAAVTVDFYRTLPAHGYRFILLQTHSTSQVVLEEERANSGEYPPGPFLFTSELYEQSRYLTLQLDDQIRASKLLFEESPMLFAVGPTFVRKSMQGRFEDTLIIIGGCQSMAYPDLAQAFLDRGASAVIGWDEMVSLAHNNKAVLHLLQALTVDGLSPDEAVEATMDEVGPDPAYGSALILLQREP